MTSILTAAVVSGYQARITWTPDPADAGGTAQYVTLLRSSGTLGDQVVMGGENVPNGANSWDDPEVPFGVPTTWKIIPAQGPTFTSSTITVTGPPISGMAGRAGAVLSDPRRGIHVPVVVLDEHVPTGRKSRAAAVDVEGRASRVIITSVEGAPTRTPRFLTETLLDAAAADEVLAPGRAVLLRSSCPAVPDEWLQPVGDRTVGLLAGSGSPVRVHALGETEVLAGNPEPDVRALGDTLADLATVVPTTLIALSAQWASLAAIAAADLKGMMA